MSIRKVNKLCKVKPKIEPHKHTRIVPQCQEVSDLFPNAKSAAINSHQVAMRPR